MATASPSAWEVCEFDGACTIYLCGCYFQHFDPSNLLYFQLHLRFRVTFENLQVCTLTPVRAISTQARTKGHFVPLRLLKAGGGSTLLQHSASVVAYDLPSVGYIRGFHRMARARPTQATYTPPEIAGRLSTCTHKCRRPPLLTEENTTESSRLEAHTANCLVGLLQASSPSAQFPPVKDSGKNSHRESFGDPENKQPAEGCRREAGFPLERKIWHARVCIGEPTRTNRAPLLLTLTQSSHEHQYINMPIPHMALTLQRHNLSEAQSKTHDPRNQDLAPVPGLSLTSSSGRSGLLHQLHRKLEPR